MILLILIILLINSKNIENTIINNIINIFKTLLIINNTYKKISK